MPPSPNNLNPARRKSVRLALATGATLTTLLGLQALAVSDQPNFAAQPTTANVLNITLAAPENTLVLTPKSILPPAPPNLVIIKQVGGQGQPIATVISGGNIAAPKPVVMAPPPPIVVQGSGGESAPQAAPIQPAPVQPAPITQPSR